MLFTASAAKPEVHGDSDRMSANTEPASQQELLRDALRILQSYKANRVDLTPDTVYYLLRNKGISRDSIAELFKELAKSGALHFPAFNHLELLLTEGCNLACSYCFVQGKNAEHRMRFETAKRGIDYFLAHSGNHKQVKLLFFGGEPLLEYDLIVQCTRYAEDKVRKLKKAIRFDVTSNGTLITEEKARFFKDHKVHILLSLDGGEREHDTYRRTLGNRPTFKLVLQNLRLLKAYQPWIGAKVTVMPEFAAGVHEGIMSLARHGVNHFIIGYASGSCYPLEAGRDFLTSLELLYDWWRRRGPSGRPVIQVINDALNTNEENVRHKWGCRAGRTGITVNSRGEIYGCSRLIGTNGSKGVLPLGNLDEGITQVEDRMTLCGYLPPDRPGCWSCLSQSRCLGGCYAVNFSTTGDPFRSGPECHMIAAGNRFKDFVRKMDGEGRSVVSKEWRQIQ